MKTSELIKLLKKYDVKFIEYRGRHDWYYSSITKKAFLYGVMLKKYQR